MKIVNIYDEDHSVLHKKSELIKLDQDGLREAKEISDKLIDTLMPLMPAAGMAAPQIGVSKTVFVYSWDRKPENIEIIINPRILSLTKDITYSWEACFSAMNTNKAKAVNMRRPSSIEVEYYNLKGEKIRARLKNYSARVFLHEFDHLQGRMVTDYGDSETKEFNSKEEMVEFIIKMRKDAQVHYMKPEYL
jgi:peptide deformylase